MYVAQTMLVTSLLKTHLNPFDRCVIGTTFIISLNILRKISYKNVPLLSKYWYTLNLVICTETACCATCIQQNASYYSMQSIHRDGSPIHQLKEPCKSHDDSM